MDNSRFDNLPFQEAYGNLLGKLVNIGLLLLTGTFVAYVAGVLPPLVPFDQLSRLWTLPLHEFLAETGAPTGWQWTGMLGTGDYLTLLAIAFLASTSVICYLAMLANSIQHGRKIMAVIIAIEIGLIALAASNILSVGGH